MLKTVVYIHGRSRTGVIDTWVHPMLIILLYGGVYGSGTVCGYNTEREILRELMPRCTVCTASNVTETEEMSRRLCQYKNVHSVLSTLILWVQGSLRVREITCSASDLQCLNFESSVWRAVSSHSSHHPQEVLLVQFSLNVHKSGLRPDSFHFHI